MKQKEQVSLLLCGVMLYYAVPRIQLNTESVQGVFGLSWMLLALFVIGGNVSSLLYRRPQIARTKAKRTGKRVIRQRGQ